MTYAQIEAAKGIKYLMAREKKGGKFVPVTEELAKAIVSGQDGLHEMMEVWEKPPSTQAFSDLMDRAMDKPTQMVDMNAKVSGTIDLVTRLRSARKRVNAGS